MRGARLLFAAALIGGLLHSTSTHAQPQQQQNDTRTNSSDIVIGYVGNAPTPKQLGGGRGGPPNSLPVLSPQPPQQQQPPAKQQSPAVGSTVSKGVDAQPLQPPQPPMRVQRLPPAVIIPTQNHTDALPPLACQLSPPVSGIVSLNRGVCAACLDVAVQADIQPATVQAYFTLLL